MPNSGGEVSKRGLPGVLHRLIDACVFDWATGLSAS
jgi:hypothetical protein